MKYTVSGTDSYFYIPSSCVNEQGIMTGTFGSVFKNIYDDNYHHPQTVYKAIVINGTLIPVIFETMALPDKNTAIESGKLSTQQDMAAHQANETIPVYCELVDDSGERYQDYYSNQHLLHQLGYTSEHYT